MSEVIKIKTKINKDIKEMGQHIIDVADDLEGVMVFEIPKDPDTIMKIFHTDLSYIKMVGYLEIIKDYFIDDLKDC